MSWLRRLSITSRIAIGSLVVAALFGTVAMVGLRFGVAAVLHNATVTQLRNDAAPYLEALAQTPAQAIDTPVEGQLVAVVDPSGRVLKSTLTERLQPKLHWFTTLPDKPRAVRTAGSEYIVLPQHVTTSAGTFVVIAARNDEAAEVVLDKLTMVMLVGAGVLVAGFGAASWLLAHTALSPVSRMRRQAEALVDGTSAEPLGAGPAHDELAELAATLNDLIGRLRASAERERQMVSDASHELRTPLAVLQGQLELAELDSGDADALLADLRSSRATVLRLSQLATNLLELSRIEAGVGAVPGYAQTAHTPWRELTAELADAIDRARTLSDDDLSIDFDYAHEGSGTVALSVREFGRILDNLLGNAVAAIRGARAERSAVEAGEGPGVGGSAGADADATTPAAPREDSITAHLAHAGGCVRLTILDTGSGMPEQFIPVALDRFTRADAARSSYSGGGLGLAIVAALVAAAGGTIALSNEPGAGLRVQISLPLGP